MRLWILGLALVSACGAGIGPEGWDPFFGPAQRPGKDVVGVVCHAEGNSDLDLAGQVAESMSVLMRTTESDFNNDRLSFGTTSGKHIEIYTVYDVQVGQITLLVRGKTPMEAFSVAFTAVCRKK